VNRCPNRLNNHIELASTPEENATARMTMVTDRPPAPQRPRHPEVCNVFALHKFFSPDDVAHIEPDCRTARSVRWIARKLFAKNLNAHLGAVPDKRASSRLNPTWCGDVLAKVPGEPQVIAGRC